jgi:hypothetical protein
MGICDNQRRMRGAARTGEGEKGKFQSMLENDTPAISNVPVGAAASAVRA